jgi:hypothetical protein
MLNEGQTLAQTTPPAQAVEPVAKVTRSLIIQIMASHDISLISAHSMGSFSAEQRKQGQAATILILND